MSDLWLWLTHLRVTDVLDIAVLWFLAYRVLLLLRGTRAFQSLLGLGVLLVVYILSARLELYGIHWMLEKFFVYIVLALIILFQTDIKRGLASTGGSLFPRFTGRPDPSTFEEVVKASFQMASRRIGALIAIEREAALDDYADSGHRLDARVSADLLLALFHPTSPLHDGAVLIRQGRVLAAKVFLPLSLSREVHRFYGTRHRAAIGLTEETDAVVIIVSEERGAVGVVVAGEVQPVASADELRERLTAYFAPAPDARRKGAAR